MAALINRIESIYALKKPSDWPDERPIVTTLIKQIEDDISSNYAVLDDTVHMGSTALVWTVKDKKLGVTRALKMPRPRAGKIPKLIKVIRDEAEKLKSLNHQNVIKIYWHSQVTVNDNAYPYYIMEYLPEIKDFRQILTDSQLTLQRLIELLAEIAEGIACLHANDIIHCDLKPENLLVPKSSPPLVADLGYSKYFTAAPGTDGDRFTEMTFTQKYAHPDLRKIIKAVSDSAANVTEIRRSNLRAAFDLYALGRTIFELMRLFLHHQILDNIRVREISGDDQSFEFLKFPLERSISEIDPYVWHYLWIIAARLLDGKNDSATCAPGLSSGVMGQINYHSIDEVRLDFLKLRNRYSVEHQIPELNIYEEGILQIASQSPVVFSDRVRALYNHPHMHRLARLSQLGLLRYIYPGAVHSRLEHSLGTFANTCRYVRSLYNDYANPLFKSIMSEKDIKAVLLAALLHDLGHYPFAHDLEEVDRGLFEHEDFTFEILESGGAIDGSPPLSAIITKEWSVDVGSIQAIIDAKRKDRLFDFRVQILASIIDGPIDADKLDYLYRDSVHIGVPYGQALDFDRLCKCLTVTYSDADKVVSIGISEKGRISAESVAFARYAMFMCAYWHHTSRALKVMLREAAKDVLKLVGRDEASRRKFREDFKSYIFEGLGAGVQLNLLPYSGPVNPNKMDHSDARMLGWFHERAGPKGQRMIEAILNRKIVQRVRVISSQLSPQLHDLISDLFLKHPETTVDKFTEEFQQTLKAELIKRWRADQSTPEKWSEELSKEDALILIDAPSYHGGAEKELRYLREKSAGTYELEGSIVWRDLHDDFNKNVSKVRIFAHWDWGDRLKNTLRPEEIDRLLSETYEGLSRAGYVKKR
jgi:serine/threonine protein kinase